MHERPATPNESARFGEELVRASVQRLTDIVDLAAAESRLARLAALRATNEPHDQPEAGLSAPPIAT